ncbi:MAG: hypothetical protein M3081_21890 [Gemmatimonadota bacterium]|nr:hypothetical protein [Gemmatimonadota bacterium]
MYSTCLFCNSDLDRNEVIERFPIGRRLAFDSHKGRLWVVCRKCARWNLTPLEERWEAIEDCERRYRDTTLRVSTENIGLAKLREGLELVRIGKPLRPEFAAWRYGDQFGRRRRKTVIAGGAGAAIAVVAAPVAIAYTSLFILGYMVPSLTLPYTALRDYLVMERPVARVKIGTRKLNVRVKHLRDSKLVADEVGAEPVLELAHDLGHERITGPAGMRVAASLLARTNLTGGSAGQVSAAVRRIEAVGDPAHFFVEASRLSRRSGGRVMAKMRAIGALNLSPVERLALEMAMHEETERRALEGELALLEEAWREAEEVAGISDSLFLPIEIDTHWTPRRSATEQP